MRQVYSAILLFAFVYSIIRPAVPLIDYYLNKEYIAEELCENKEEPEMHCDGKCHLKKQIEKVSVEEQDTSPTSPAKPRLKIEENNYLYDTKNAQGMLCSISKEEAYTNRYINLYSTVQLELDSPPPQC